MSNPQPLYCEGYCPHCQYPFWAIHVKDDNVRTLNCGQCKNDFSVTWRYLVISDTPGTCTSCHREVYEEKGNPPVTFILVNGKVERHMCGLVLQNTVLQ